MTQRYRKRLVNGRHESEHRLVWEAANGPIPPGYVVHHIDEDKMNNDLSNLACMTHEEHTSLHRSIHAKVKTCVVCLQEYTPHATSRQKQQTCGAPLCKSALLSLRARQRHQEVVWA